MPIGSGSRRNGGVWKRYLAKKQVRNNCFDVDADAEDGESSKVICQLGLIPRSVMKIGPEWRVAGEWCGFYRRDVRCPWEFGRRRADTVCVGILAPACVAALWRRSV